MGYRYRNSNNGDETVLPQRNARLDRLANWTLVDEPAPRAPGRLVESHGWSEPPEATSEPEREPAGPVAPPPDLALVVVHHPKTPRKRATGGKIAPTKGA